MDLAVHCGECCCTPPRAAAPASETGATCPRRYGPEDCTRHGNYRDDDPRSVITQVRRDSSTSELTTNAANLHDEARPGEAGHNEALYDEALRDEALPDEALCDEAPMKHCSV